MARRRKTRAADPGTVLQVFKKSKKPLTAQEIRRELGLKDRDTETVEHMLQQLESQGKILHLRRGAYGLMENMRLITGTLEVQRSGVGFVIPDSGKGQDIFVSQDNLADAWNGDRVAVAVFPHRGGKRPEGRIARIIERKKTRFTARVTKGLGGYTLCQSTDTRQQLQFMVDTSSVERSLKPGQVLLLEPGEHMDRDLWAATVLDVLGHEEDVSVQESLVKVNQDIRTEFPKAALDEAAGLPKDPDLSDFTGRKDLRSMDFVTIDGAKARDFDDAICVLPEENGYRLYVAIADVAHYVPQDSALDEEARLRGNSYYFPQSVEPMFPEALSNGLCSLRPEVPRLAMVAEMGYSSQGLPRMDDVAFYPAVIESKFRLTYEQVKAAVLDQEQQTRTDLKAILPMLETAETLARQINARRSERGSLDFDLPEPEIHFNLQGETVDIRPRVRHFAHQIIEEFMIAANEAVARRLQERSLPCLYRIHEEPDPDKLQALYDVVERSELAENVQRPSGTPSPSDLQELLQAAEGSEMEFIVGRLTLRAMMQAKYSPINVGHYGLASDCYCHFTSPIRRYADLVVHRSMKQMLAQDAGTTPTARIKGLKALGVQLSHLERKAMDAERETLKRITVLFLRDRVGERFTGVINSITDFGFWVELQEVMAEGLVRLSTLHDDYYAFIPERQELLGERTGRRFRMGQRITVQLADVNLSRLEVTLDLVQGGEAEDTVREDNEIQDGGDQPRRPAKQPRKKPAPVGKPKRRSGSPASRTSRKGGSNNQNRKSEKPSRRSRPPAKKGRKH